MVDDHYVVTRNDKNGTGDNFSLLISSFILFLKMNESIYRC